MSNTKQVGSSIVKNRFKGAGIESFTGKTKVFLKPIVCVKHIFTLTDGCPLAAGILKVNLGHSSCCISQRFGRKEFMAGRQNRLDPTDKFINAYLSVNPKK